jgi:hypothetical protein
MRLATVLEMALWVAIISSCAPAHEFSASETKTFEDAKTAIGSSIKLAPHATSAELCSTLGEEVLDCLPIGSGQQLTIDQVTLTTGGSTYVHAYTSRISGYMPIEKFNLLQFEAKNCHDYEPRIGMSEEEVLGSAWCFPDSKNTTETAGHTMEQWVYPHWGYLYIDDGVLTTIQRM